MVVVTRYRAEPSTYQQPRICIVPRTFTLLSDRVALRPCIGEIARARLLWAGFRARRARYGCAYQDIIHRQPTLGVPRDGSTPWGTRPIPLHTCLIVAWTGAITAQTCARRCMNDSPPAARDRNKWAEIGDLFVRHVTCIGLAATEKQEQNLMIRAQQGASSDSCWESVSRKLPCPLCGAETGCRLHGDQPFVLCLQMPSVWPLQGGGGLHRDVPAARDGRASSGVYAAHDVTGPRKALASRSVERSLSLGK